MTLATFRSMMIANFILCSERTLPEVLDGVTLKNVPGGKPETPIFLPHLFHNCPVLSKAIVDLHASNFRDVKLYAGYVQLSINETVHN